MKHDALVFCALYPRLVHHAALSRTFDEASVRFEIQYIYKHTAHFHTSTRHEDYRTSCNAYYAERCSACLAISIIGSRLTAPSQCTSKMGHSETGVKAVVDKLKRAAKRFERTNKHAAIGKISGSVVAIGGGVATAGTAFALATSAVCPPVGVAMLAAGSVAMTAGSAIGGACQVTKAVKNRRRKSDVMKALSEYRKYMAAMLEQLRPHVEDGPANVPVEMGRRMHLLYCLYSFGALGVSMAPHELEAKAEVVNTILMRGSPADLHELEHNQVLETLLEWDIPGFSTVLDNTGITEVGADGVFEAVGEMIFDNVAPLQVFLLPMHIVFLGIESRKFHMKEYKKAADAVRKLAEKN